MTPIVLIVGPVFGHTFLHFPLYVVEAVLVELAGLALAAAARSRSAPPRAR